MKILTGFKLDDVTMSDTFLAVSIDTRQLHFTYMDVISTGKKSMIIGNLACVARLHAQFYAGERKPLGDF